MQAIDIQIDLASDDSCQIRLWARGHHEAAAFLAACEQRLRAYDERRGSLAAHSVRHEHWRTVKADAETRSYGVADLVHIRSAPGRGAYNVTVLEGWLPLYRYHDQDAEVQA